MELYRQNLKIFFQGEIQVFPGESIGFQFSTISPRKKRQLIMGEK